MPTVQPANPGGTSVFFKFCISLVTSGFLLQNPRLVCWENQHVVYLLRVCNIIMRFFMVDERTKYYIQYLFARQGLLSFEEV